MTDREQQLLIQALSMLESACFAEEVMKSEMAETPVTDEIQTLMNKIHSKEIVCT